MASRKRQAKSEQSSSNKKIKFQNRSTEFTCSNKTDENLKGFLTGINAYILPAGIEKARLEIFKNQIIKNDGCVQEKFDLHANLTHIVVDDKMEVSRMLKLLKIDVFPDIIVVRSAWLSSCLRNKELVSVDDFKLQNTLPVPAENKPEARRVSVASLPLDLQGDLSNLNAIQNVPKVDKLWNSHPKVEIAESGSGSSDSEHDDYDFDKLEETPSVAVKPSFSTQKQVPIEKWICAQSSKNTAPNFNQNIVAKLEEAKALPNVGKRLADKIWEIAQSGELRKLKEFEASEDIRVLKLFTNVWGAGPHTARLWYQQGFRTILDLKNKAKLTHQQEVGVRLYDDLLERMPREEAGEIERTVREAAESIQDGIVAQACGSYRRGRLTCGDVDVLITHPDGKSHKGLFHILLLKLKESASSAGHHFCALQ